MTRENEKRDGQFAAALHAFDVSTLNAIICLAARLRGGGALDDDQVRALHEQLSYPLSEPEVADNPFIPPMQDYIDDRLAWLAQVRPGK